MPPSQPTKRRGLLRLRHFDYATPGAYFVTLCTWGRRSLFGRISNGEMHLNALGDIVRACWLELPAHYPDIVLDVFVVMPNHFHGVVILPGAAGTGLKPAPTRGAILSTTSLPKIVRALKTFTSRQIHTLSGKQGLLVWQRNYYDRIVRRPRVPRDSGVHPQQPGEVGVR